MSEFRVIVAGSRTFKSYPRLRAALDHYLVNKLKTHDVVIISGTARGADQLGEQYAQERGLKCLQFPAEWDKYGKAAGYRRNEQMAQVADALIAFWDGQSRGTTHMINIMYKMGKITRIVRF